MYSITLTSEKNIKRRISLFFIQSSVNIFVFFKRFDLIMSEYKRNEFQEKVQKFLSGEDTSNKCSRRPENSTEDIKGIRKYLNII
jgi:hypothetical protein